MVCELWHFEAILPPRKRFAGLLAPQRVQPAKTNFLGSFRIFGRILELHFFRFWKNFFSLHPKFSKLAKTENAFCTATSKQKRSFNCTGLNANVRWQPMTLNEKPTLNIYYGGKRRQINQTNRWHMAALGLSSTSNVSQYDGYYVECNRWRPCMSGRPGSSPVATEGGLWWVQPPPNIASSPSKLKYETI